jgi:hypothetical protein
MGGAPDTSIFAGASPWQQWGNTQIVTAPANLFTNPNANEQQITLLRVQYNRPETWRFLFSARILDAQPDPDGSHQFHIDVWFDLFTGIGRSAIPIRFWVTLPEWQWGLLSPAVPRNQPFWTNTTGNSQVVSTIVQLPDGTIEKTLLGSGQTETITGQDMTVVAHVNYTTDLAGATPAQVEVSGQFAPNVHVRPDWFLLDGHPSEQFAGGEVKGR